MKIRLIKRHGVLLPFDDQAEEVISKWESDVLLEAEVKKPRNYEHHKKFFALVQIVLTQTPHFQSMNEALEWFKIKCGIYKIIRIGDTHYPITGSISFSSMTQDEFNIFYDKAIDAALSVLDVGQEDLAQKIANF